MPQIRLRPFIAGNVVEDGRRVKVTCGRRIGQLHKASPRPVEMMDFGPQRIARPGGTWESRIARPRAPVNETFTPPSHS
jgi:hypothetical protein